MESSEFFSEFPSSEYSVLGIRSKLKSWERKSQKQNIEVSELSEFLTWPMRRSKTQTHLKLYKKDKNFCSKLYKRERRKYYESLDTKNALDSKKCWKMMRPFLSDKNTVLLQISIEKYNLTVTISDWWFWFVWKGLSLSLEVLLGCSMPSQMNEYCLKRHRLSV